MAYDAGSLKFRDELCYSLGHFLANFLNESYDEAVVVRSMRTYDALQIPLALFPLLKVFRVSDTYKLQTTHSTSLVEISYNITFPEVEELPGLMSFVSDKLNLGLLTYQKTVKADFPFDLRSPVTITYLIKQNDIIGQVYPALSTQIPLSKGCGV